MANKLSAHFHLCVNYSFKQIPDYRWFVLMIFIITVMACDHLMSMKILLLDRLIFIWLWKSNKVPYSVTDGREMKVSSFYTSATLCLHTATDSQFSYTWVIEKIHFIFDFQNKSFEHYWELVSILVYFTARLMCLHYDKQKSMSLN